MTACPDSSALAIVADRKIPGVLEDFAAFGSVTGLAEFSAAALAGADVVLVRSRTRVDQTLLGAARPRFVGSATSGVDHVDRAWLARQGIAFAHAPGCNARAVAEYVLSCLGVVALDRGVPLSALAVGIVGCGHIGSCLYGLLQTLGVRCVINDPPLRARPQLPANLPAARLGLAREDFRPLSELCQMDVVSLHVPLTQAGEAPTVGLLGREFLRAAREDLVVINTARGGVVDEQALLEHLRTHSRAEAMLDVWQDEPHINTALLDRARIATPHIAGYSRLGRRAASRMLCQALARHLGQPAPASVPPALPTGRAAELSPSPLATPAVSMRHDVETSAPALMHAAGSTGHASPSAPTPPAHAVPMEHAAEAILSHYDVRKDSLPPVSTGASAAQLFCERRRGYVPREEFSLALAGLPQAV